MPTPTNQFRLKLAPSTAYNFYINWGDGSSEIFNQTTNGLEISAGLTHTYPTSGSYTLSITENVSGGFPRIYSGPNSSLFNNDAIKITDIIQWGNVKFSNMFQSFYQCYNLSSVPTDNGTLSSVSDFDYAWYYCSNPKFNIFPLINTSKCKGLLDRTWASCSYLTAFPLIDTSKINIFNRPWQSCRNLVSFPLINTLCATYLTNTWENCEKLTTFPLISTNNVVDFNTTWSQCYKLTSFPLINTSKSTSFYATWQYCNELKSFPLIDTSKGTNFAYCWRINRSLTDFPLLNTLSGTDFTYAWNDCRSLTSFPLLDTRNADSLNLAWEGCYSLTSFPLLNTSKVTVFFGAWSNCYSLTSFPLINTLSGINFSSSWKDCRSLTSFPYLSTQNGNNFSETWWGCTRLSATDFPTLNMSKMTNGTNCFNGVKLTTNSYSLLLSSICATNINNTVTFHGGNSNYNSTFGLSARNYLVNTKGWTITDGGLETATPEFSFLIDTNYPAQGYL